MILLLLAYARREHWTATAYASLNLVGAGLLAVVCFAQAAWPAFVLEIIWGAISLRDLWRSPRRVPKVF